MHQGLGCRTRTWQHLGWPHHISGVTLCHRSACQHAATGRLDYFQVEPCTLGRLRQRTSARRPAAVQEDEAVDEDDELQIAEWDQAAADAAYREQVGVGSTVVVHTWPCWAATTAFSEPGTTIHNLASSSPRGCPHPAATLGSCRSRAPAAARTCLSAAPWLAGRSSTPHQRRVRKHSVHMPVCNAA